MRRTVYNRRRIMEKAWEVCKARGLAFSECLKRAWADAKARVAAINVIGDEVHSWYGWKMLGYEVIHGSEALFKLVEMDAKTKSGERVVSYFSKAQVARLVYAE